MRTDIRLSIDVYRATQQRLKYIFEHFDNIYLSFSGGKDSGILLETTLQYMRENNITKKIGVFHQDFEAQYSATTEYVERTLRDNLDLITPYWVCLPMACKTATSMFEQYWLPWECAKKDIWVRDMPTDECVINIDNHQFDFYKYGMLQEDVYRQFGGWYHRHVGGKKGKTIGLVGIRTQESLNRYRAIVAKKSCFNDKPWTTKIIKDVYTGYPVYDWTAEDVWTANAKFEFDYNNLYDLFHYAGLSVHEMRVASPFNDWAINSLKLYRVLEPGIWASMIGRVHGANFCAIYGGTSATGWKKIKLPKGHTWQSYVEFLLKTLPDETAATYREKFATSIKFWRERGGVLSEETITELHGIGIECVVGGKSNYNSDKKLVTFNAYPDEPDVKEFQSVPSYKRMAICILKNDHLCKFMGFSQTKVESEKRKAAIAKYKSL
ncbi:MAG: putative phosphoadenosine phosphosulfate sulfurtransferase [Psychromonas sp.]|jgi:predicted phosphoadenosine phosphosulfate sulfurtransferase